MKEIGGKDSAHMHNMQSFCDHIFMILSLSHKQKLTVQREDEEGEEDKYCTTGLIYEPDLKAANFAALGCLFMAKQSILDLVRVWNFKENTFESCFSHKHNHNMQIFAQNCSFVLNNRFYNTKSRKGFQHSKWQIGNKIFDLVHYYHLLLRIVVSIL